MKKVRWVCDFCEKTQDEVRQIITGPRDIAICNECVDLCVKIFNETAEPVEAATIALNDKKGGDL